MVHFSGMCMSDSVTVIYVQNISGGNGTASTATAVPKFDLAVPKLAVHNSNIN